MSDDHCASLILHHSALLQPGDLHSHARSGLFVAAQHGLSCVKMGIETGLLGVFFEVVCSAYCSREMLLLETVGAVVYRDSLVHKTSYHALFWINLSHFLYLFLKKNERPQCVCMYVKGKKNVQLHGQLC